MDGTLSDRKQLMENMITVSVQLSESGGIVIMLFLTHHNPSSCVLDCLQPIDLHLWQSN